MNTIKPITSIAVGRASRQPLQRTRGLLAVTAAWLHSRWRRARLDERNRYLADAVDHADLERRQRALDRSGWRPPC